MSHPHLSISLGDATEEVGLVAASALFGMAAAQSGASVEDIQLGDIALSELIETLNQGRMLESVRLDKSPTGYRLTLGYPADIDYRSFPEGAQQVVDAAFASWQLTPTGAVIALSPSTYATSHD